VLGREIIRKFELDYLRCIGRGNHQKQKQYYKHNQCDLSSHFGNSFPFEEIDEIFWMDDMKGLNSFQGCSLAEG
jgi:hypothetical protein